MFPLQSYIVFRSYLYVFDPFCVNFCMWYEIRVQTHSFSCGYPVVPALFVKKIILSLLRCPGSLTENQFSCTYMDLFLDSYSIPLIYISIFMPAPHYFILFIYLFI